jgi:hypothetical protein
MNVRVIGFLGLLLLAGNLPASIYQTSEAFLDEVFAGSPPPAGVLWLKGDIAETATSILGHRYPALRLRYWQQGARSAWILEEIGKEKPITVGLVVDAESLETIRVLAFRESRGWEVRHPFFTDQFSGIGLKNNLRLNRTIDGISGATLSVRALKKLARLALYLHTRIPPSSDTPS